MKSINIIWAISLIVIGVATVALVGKIFIGIEIPDNLIRVLCTGDLLCIFLLVFTTVKKVRRA